jgi:regulator of RNase E activity RraA
MGAALTAQNRGRLAEVGVSTLTTCLYRRGIRNAYLHGIVPLNKATRMVGEAFTLRFVPAREDVTDTRNNLHQRAFDECPAGAVLVIDAQRELEACTCGDLLVARLKALGAAGIVTDGGFRDSAEIAQLAFPAYHARPVPPPSFLRLHAVALNEPIGCARVAVYPGDIVVGDVEGVVVLPAAMANEIAEQAQELSNYDEFAAEQVRGGRSVVGLYPPTDASRAEHAAWRKHKN